MELIVAACTSVEAVGKLACKLSSIHLRQKSNPSCTKIVLKWQPQQSMQAGHRTYSARMVEARLAVKTIAAIAVRMPH